MSKSQREKEHSTKWAKMLKEKFGVWSHRIVDTPSLTPSGFATNKKPFDRIICFDAWAVEFKFCTGKTHNLKSWRENEKTRHQYRNLKEFNESNSGRSMLVCIWKQIGKRDLQWKFLFFEELDQDRVAYEDMHDVRYLEKLIEEMYE